MRRSRVSGAQITGRHCLRWRATLRGKLTAPDFKEITNPCGSDILLFRSEIGGMPGKDAAKATGRRGAGVKLVAFSCTLVNQPAQRSLDLTCIALCCWGCAIRNRSHAPVRGSLPDVIIRLRARGGGGSARRGRRVVPVIVSHVREGKRKKSRNLTQTIGPDCCP